MKHKKIITVMCDYCADGLWLNGGAIDLDYLLETGDFEKEGLESLRKDITNWQEMYERFNLYSNPEETLSVYKSSSFIEFEKLGRDIFRRLDSLNNSSGNKYTIVYFNEKNSKRYKLVDHKYVEIPRKTKRK